MAKILDEIDLKIIELLQQNAKMSMKELASIIHLSPPAATERVRKLEDQQIIENYQAQLNLKKIGRTIEAIILFKSIDCKALAKFCEEHPAVISCYRVAGEISYIAHVATDSVESLEQFIDASMVYGTPSTNIVLSSVAEQIILPLK